MWEKTPSIKLPKKYLGIFLDKHLDWSPHINHLSHKIVKANATHCRLFHYVNEVAITSIYYVIFYFHLSYVCSAEGQNLNPKHCTNLLQKKAMQIISFAHYDAHTLPIFAKLNIIKFCNCLLNFKHVIRKPASIFLHVFI